MSVWYLVWWYLGLQVLALAVAPLCFLGFYRFRDRGWGFSKSFGILLVIYPVWLLAHAAPIYGKTALVISLLGFIVLSGVLWACFFQHIKSFFTSQWRRMLIVELVFLVSYLGFAWVRSYHADFAPRVQGYGSEKFMDIQFVNGIRLSPQFPPQDPWLAGYTINYYYYGYYTCAALCDLFGVPTRYGYNLALITVATLAFLNAYLIAYQLTKRSWAGVLAGFVVMVLGNPKSAIWTLWQDAIPAHEKTGIPYLWACSRVIAPPGEGSTINEFPYFSFLWGDLHGHISAFPFTLLIVGCCLAVWPATGAGLATALGVLLTAVAYGSTIATNPWDLPTYGLLILMTTLAFWRGAPDDNNNPHPVITFFTGVFLRLLIIAFGIVLIIPFASHFVAPKTGLNWAITQKTAMNQFLMMFGLHAWALLILLIALVIVWFRRFRWWIPTVLLALGIISMLIGWWYSGVHTARFGEPVIKYWFVGWMVLALFLIVIETIRIKLSAGSWFPFPCWQDQNSDHEESAFIPTPDRESFVNGAFVLVLCFLSACVLLGCEFVAMPDFYGKSNERMNTLFKFHYGVWALLGIVVAWVTVRCWNWITSRNLANIALGGIGIAGIVLLVGMNSFFPIRGTIIRSNNFKYPDGQTPASPTLDGLAFMTNPAYRDDYQPGDYEAVVWLQKNWVPKPDGALPILLETSTGETYSYNSRIGTFTGLPTFLGWGNHEGIWREQQAQHGGRRQGNEPGMRALINQREDQIKRMYRTTCMNTVKPMLENHSIDYVIVGPTERKTYGQQRLQKFERYMQVAFQSSGTNPDLQTTVYRGFPPNIDELLAEEVCEELPDPERPPIPARAPNTVWTAGAYGSGPEQCSEPRGLAVSEDGTVYVADSGNHRVLVISPDGQVVRHWGERGTGNGNFDSPQDIAINHLGQVLVADTWNGIIQVFTPEGEFVHQFGNPPGQQIGSSAGHFYGPRGLTADSEGNIYVADTGNKRIQKFSPEGNFLLQWRSWRPDSFGQEEFKEPVGIANMNQEIFVVDTGNLRVVVFDLSGHYQRHFFVYGTWQRNVVGTEPHIEITPDGMAWLTSSVDGWVQGFDSSGKLQVLFGGLNRPIGISGHAERLFVSNTGAHQVMAITTSP